MSLGNWGQNFLRDVAGGFFGNEYLRDYTHASKIFRTNSYANSPKLKFLFHTYFEINPDAYDVADTNYGLLVKELSLPTFSMKTHQLNQYNRKRIVQTKISYDSVNITFHDDNSNRIAQLWEAYYTYYYNDGTKPQAVLNGNRGSDSPQGQSSNPLTSYNDRNIYNPSITGDDDWGFTGGTSSGKETKVPFFKNITVFGFNQHSFIAYTLVNPIITQFAHGSYNYSESGGTMENRMTIDYETVVYNEGAMDGRSPSDIATGFGSSDSYDTSTSPIMAEGGNATILGRGGLIDAAGGTINKLSNGNVLGAIKTAGTAYNTFANPNLKETAALELTGMLYNTLQNSPSNRNTLFSMPKAASTPGPLGTAGFPTIGAKSTSILTETNQYAGSQNDGSSSLNGYNGGFPIDPPLLKGNSGFI